MEEIYLSIDEEGWAASYLRAEAPDRYCARDGRFVLVAGEPRDAWDHRLDAKGVLCLYLERGEALCLQLTGLYSLVVYEPVRQEILLFQDPFGGLKPLNFHWTGRSLRISTSLKRLIPELKGERKLCPEAAEAYLTYGAVTDERTLVEGIYKLPARKRAVLNVRTGARRLRANRYDERGDRPRPDEGKYVAALESSLKGALAPEQISLTLSSGFDSNLILSVLREMTDRPIDAYGVGGRSGLDETRIAEQIAASYPNVRFMRGLVDGDALERLPDIVFRLEGSVYERGVFLQYALAEMARREGVKHMLFGEGADQVMSLYYATPVNALSRLRARFFAPCRLNARDMLASVILRKNAMMMDSVGVKPEYPYLREPLLRAARALYARNRTGKRFHARITVQRLGAGRGATLKKIGGSTGLEALFGEKMPYDRFRRLALSLPRHDARRPVYDRYGAEESERSYCLALMSLYLFEQIFLSGRYDQALQEPRLDVPLSKFLEAIPVRDGQEGVRVVGRCALYRILRRCYRFIMR